jgi:5'-nucleotidase / UDP-sugar diphosphatase
MRIHTFYLLLGCVLCIVLAGSLVFKSYVKEDFTLTILHFNDFHSRFEPSYPDDDTDCTDDPQCVGGIARLKTLIDQERSKNAHTLLFSAGDNYQGSLFFSVFKEEALVEVLNTLTLDAMGFGNHEFDEGSKSLSQFIAKANFRIVSGNVHAASTSPLFGHLTPYEIFEFNGQQVGVISAVTSNTPALSSPESDVTFEDEQEYLRKTAQELTEKDISIIIAITHQGYEQDLKLAQTVPFIDVIIGGHSDTLLSNIQKDAEGPYPAVIEKEGGQKTLVVQTKPYGTQLGRLQVSFNAQGSITGYAGEPIIVDSEIQPYAPLVAYIDSLKEQLASTSEIVIGTTAQKIHGYPEECRNDDCPMGNLLSSALVSYEDNRNASIALLNSGSIRSSLPSGVVTKNDLITAVPFNNALTYAKISGTDLLSMIQTSVSQAGERSGGFLQIAGLTVYYETSDNAGGSICSVVEEKTGMEIRPEGTYNIVTNAYIANGGDGYKSLEGATTSKATLYDALEEYFANNQYYQPSLDDRIIEHCYE